MMSEISKYHDLPQPDEIDERQREDAMGAYFMMFATIGIGLPLPLINMVAAIIYYYLYKKSSRFVRFHALQSLTSQIPVSILNAGAVIWAVIVIFFGGSWNWNFISYLIITLLANITYIIFSLIAAYKARKGRFYYFAVFGKFAYHRVFIKVNDTVENEYNSPPAR